MQTVVFSVESSLPPTRTADGAPTCWVELRAIVEGAEGSLPPTMCHDACTWPSNEASCQASSQQQNLPSSTTGVPGDQCIASTVVYREPALLQDINTLGPLQLGMFELVLSDCYGSVDGDIVALVSMLLLTSTKSLSSPLYHCSLSRHFK